MRFNTTVSHASPLLMYVPNLLWNEGRASNISEDSFWSTYPFQSYHYTDRAMANVSFWWMGSGVWVYGGSNGSYTVTLDDVSSTQDDSSGGLLYGNSDLNSEDIHTLVVSNTGEGIVGIHSLTIESDSGTQELSKETIWHNDARFVYSSEWSQASSTMRTSTAGSVGVSFNGTSVALYGLLGQNESSYYVSIDGKRPQIYRSNSQQGSNEAQLLAFCNTLSIGDHILRLQNNPAATDGDALSIVRAEVYWSNPHAKEAPASDAYGSKSKTFAVVFGATGGAIAVLIIGTVIRRRVKRHTTEMRFQTPDPYMNTYAPWEPPSPRDLSRSSPSIEGSDVAETELAASGSSHPFASSSLLSINQRRAYSRWRKAYRCSPLGPPPSGPLPSIPSKAHTSETDVYTRPRRPLPPCPRQSSATLPPPPYNLVFT